MSSSWSIATPVGWAIRIGLMMSFSLLLSGAASSCDETPTTYPPEWAALPTVELSAGGTASIDLDDYVTDPDTADSSLTLRVSGGSSTTIAVSLNGSSHVATFTAAGAYSGSVAFEVSASDPEGNSSAIGMSAVSSPVEQSSIAFTSVSAGGSYVNPVTFSVSASSDVAEVRYSAASNNGPVVLGTSTDRAAGFPVTYSFSTLGQREITADGLSGAGGTLASVTVTITVASTTGGSAVSFVSPEDGGTYSDAIWFKASASADVTRVVYSSPYNGAVYTLGESTDAAGQFAVSHTFSNPGNRQVDAIAYDSASQKVATASITMTVTSSSSGDSGDSALGVWLWYIEGTGYTHAQLADKLAGLGVQRIYIKVADGTDLWPEATSTSVPDTYQARGLEAFAWSYNYPGSYTSQADALYQAAKAGYDGYSLDIEAEFDRKTTELHSLLDAFTDARTKAMNEGRIDTDWSMYATTWGNPKDHGMRVDIIDQYVDGHQPQTYLEVWGASYMAEAEYWVNYGTAEYRSMGANGPIHHIISTEYDEISAAQINEAFAASGPESSLWRVPGGGTPTSIWNDWAQVDWDMFGSADAAGLSFVSPLDGGWYENGIWFKVTAATEVKKVKYYADSYYLGESTDAAQSFAVKYTFSNTGTRTVTAHGYDSGGVQLGQESVTFTVVDSGGTSGGVIPGVPYYYQYNNSYNPGGSCQNTSLAMLLTYYGCSRTPDQISNKWGTSYAQTPSGLAAVFNSEASACGISRRLKAHTDGVESDVRALIAAGKPVIVHGYFTSYGHVLILLGWDGTSYTANDPAGKWNQQFKGSYSGDSDDGKYIKYGQSPVYKAIATLDGVTFYPIWYHEVL